MLARRLAAAGCKEDCEEDSTGASKTAVLEGAAEIDARLAHQRRNLEAGLERVDGAGHIVQTPQRDRVVEVGEMQDRAVVVECDPGTVELCGRGLLVARIQLLGDLEELQKGELLLACTFQGGGKHRLVC